MSALFARRQCADLVVEVSRPGAADRCHPPTTSRQVKSRGKILLAGERPLIDERSLQREWPSA